MTLLRWIPSAPASAFHAACELVAGRSLANPVLQEALAEPAANLKSLLAGADQPADAAFWLLAQAMGALRLRDADANPTGLDPCQDLREPEIRVIGNRLLNAFNDALPRAAQELELRGEPLREQWEARGPGLLHQIGKLTLPEWIVPSADVLLLVPVLGGGGRVIAGAAPAVAIEAVLANPFRDLPEVVRLGWLLAQLGIFQRSSPAFGSQQVRLAKVAPLAPLPAVLAAAEDVELIRSAEAALPLAIEAWRLGPADPRVLADWWQRYQAERPGWETALDGWERQLGR